MRSPVRLSGVRSLHQMCLSSCRQICFPSRECSPSLRGRSSLLPHLINVEQPPLVFPLSSCFSTEWRPVALAKSFGLLARFCRHHFLALDLHLIILVYAARLDVLLTIGWKWWVDHGWTPTGYPPNRSITPRSAGRGREKIRWEKSHVGEDRGSLIKHKSCTEAKEKILGFSFRFLNWMQAVGKQNATVLWYSEVYLGVIKVTSSMNSGYGACRLCVGGYPQPAGMRVYTHVDKIIPSSLKTNM